MKVEYLSYYIPRCSWISFSSLLQIFCTSCICHWRVWDVGRKWFEEVGRGSREAFPSPPIPQLRTERMHCTRRRSQLLLGLDVLILLASGALDNCHLSSQILWEPKEALSVSTLDFVNQYCVFFDTTFCTDCCLGTWKLFSFFSLWSKCQMCGRGMYPGNLLHNVTFICYFLPVD